MITTEDYCSYEIAKLLKEKGFDGVCDYAYSNKGNWFEIDRSNFDEVYCLRPTHQMAIKWLREEKNIIINVWYNGVDWDAEHYNNEDENFYLITDPSCNSYEEAVEAALKYCLENLI